MSRRLKKKRFFRPRRGWASIALPTIDAASVTEHMRRFADVYAAAIKNAMKR